MWWSKVLFFIACVGLPLVVSSLLNPRMVWIAYRKRILDNPNYRKLQKRPVPVIGGISVLLSVSAGLLLCALTHPLDDVYEIFLCMSVISLIGLYDDMFDLTYYIKFIFQVLVIVFLWHFGYRLDTLCGLFGIYRIPHVWSILFSIVAGVGLMNALNMLDGIDGLSSGMGILTNLIAMLFFYRHGHTSIAIFCGCFVGALIPFFICNVFSVKLKMFIGDSGSLLLGCMAYLVCCELLHTSHHDFKGYYMASLALALYALPVFDTLRVMFFRVRKGHSPFRADRIHLHHVLISMGFPHYVSTFLILCMQLCILGFWAVLVACGVSPKHTAFAVFVFGLLYVWCTYVFIRYVQKYCPKIFDRIQRHVAAFSHRSMWLYSRVRYLVDGHRNLSDVKAYLFGSSKKNLSQDE